MVHLAIVPLTPLVYRLIFVHALILMLGGHYTYAHVPLGFWLQDLFDLARNPYDRIGHFAQGFIPAMIAREILLRRSPLRPGKWLFFIVSCICLAISAVLRVHRMVGGADRRPGRAGVPRHAGRSLGHAVGHVPRARRRGHCAAPAVPRSRSPARAAVGDDARAIIPRVRRLARLAKIAWVAFRFGLDEFPLTGDPTGRWLRRARALDVFGRYRAPRAVRLRLALETLGPIFVKFGQVLSTRRDLLPPDIADELAKLQDRVPPFPSEHRRRRDRARARQAARRGVRGFRPHAGRERLDRAGALRDAARRHARSAVKVLRPGIGR